jgi:hypothetical protein
MTTRGFSNGAKAPVCRTQMHTPPSNRCRRQEFRFA